jgi:hypothetical protein
MQIDFNEQFEKHESLIRASRDSFANVILSTFEPETHDFERISTFRGMQIDLNGQFEKHSSSVRIRRDSLSNVRDSSFEPAKHHFGKMSAFREMQMQFLWLETLPSAEELVMSPCST